MLRRLAELLDPALAEIRVEVEAVGVTLFLLIEKPPGVMSGTVGAPPAARDRGK